MIQRRWRPTPSCAASTRSGAKQRDEFNQRLFRRDPEAVKEAWQRYYFKGEMPEEIGAGAARTTSTSAA